MKKKVRKLSLHVETLHSLDGIKANGGSLNTFTCYTDLTCYTDCGHTCDYSCGGVCSYVGCRETWFTCPI